MEISINIAHNDNAFFTTALTNYERDTLKSADNNVIFV